MRLLRFLLFRIGWVVVLAVLIWLLYAHQGIYHWAGRDSGEIENLAQVFALFAAGCFFGYKALAGYFVVNLSLSVDAQRQWYPSEQVHSSVRI